MPSKEVLLQEIQDLRSKESISTIGAMLGVIVILVGMVMLYYTRGATNLFTARSIGELFAPFVAPFGVICTGTGILAYSAHTHNNCRIKKSQLMKQLESMNPSCPNCGKDISPEFIVCPYCGEKLKS